MEFLGKIAGMKESFKRSAVASVTILLGLIVVGGLPALFLNNPIGRIANEVFSAMRTRGFKAEDLEDFTAGYYEALRKEGSVDPSLLFRDDFLEYDYKSNLRSHGAGMVGITNSHGMYDQEYTVDKPFHTWRIALLGDSMALGPFGHNYESLLEARLNDKALTSGTRKVEILNFAVSGYRITQVMETMVQKSALFHPDVYLVGITWLSLNHHWSYHIWHLLQRRIDPKYDFLRQIITEAHVLPTDSLETVDVKLTPFTPAVIRWALQQMKDEASRRNGRLVILLIPEPIPTDLVAKQFAEARPIIDKMGIPVIDLLDTFSASKDLPALRVGPDNIHPNAQGHEMLFENLYHKITLDPQLSAVVFGTEGTEAIHRAVPFSEWAQHP